MGSAPTPSFTKFAQTLQRGDRSFLSVGAKQAIRKLTNDPLARQALYGRQVTPRQMIRIGKELQKANPTVFKTYRSARTVLARLTKMEAEKATLAPQKDDGERVVDAEKAERQEKQRKGYVRAKEIGAEGKRASIAERNASARHHDVVEERSTHEEKAEEAVARDPFGDT